VIELRKVSKRFLENVVLDGVDFMVRRGETVALLGPSGVGKSVLLKHIIGLIKPDSGEVFVDGLSVPTLRRQELSELRSRIGYVFQNGALFDSMDVFENIRLGITNQDQYSDEAYCEQRVRECLRLVNLQPDVAKKLPSELSGGMRKRVGIARAIAGKPTYLLYDEPTSGLDPVNADVIDSLIERLQQEIGVTSVVVTHDVRGSFRVADRIALLWQAKIRAVGTAEQILASKDPAVQQFLERDLEMAVIHADATGIGYRVSGAEDGPEYRVPEKRITDTRHPTPGTEGGGEGGN
jgi:phospholipid/cholesterol/gamma-HCH transport system ATP-binding protein